MNSKKTAHNLEKTNEYFNYSKKTGCLGLVTNSELVCRNCRYVTEAVLTCKIFEDIKPGHVLYRKKCRNYK